MNREQKIWLSIAVVIFLGIIIYFFYNDETDVIMTESTEIILSEKNLITESDYIVSQSGAIELTVDSVSEKSWGEEAYYKDGELVIQKGGRYLLSGRMDGTLVINVYDDEQVHLILNGIEVYSYGMPAFVVESASKVIVTSTEESQNIFCDTEYRMDEEKNSCIYSVADMTFNGSGTLNVWGYYQDAIASKGRIKVIQGNYAIRAVDDGIRGRDGVVIAGGTFDLQAEGCGIKSTNTENVKKGDVYIQGGNLTIIAGEHAVDSARNIEVNDCMIATRTILDNFACKGELLLSEECINELYK